MTVNGNAVMYVPNGSDLSSQSTEKDVKRGFPGVKSSWFVQVLIFIVGLGLGLAVGYLILRSAENDIEKRSNYDTVERDPAAQSSTTSYPYFHKSKSRHQCPAKVHITKSTSPASRGIFELLTVKEMESVRAFLLAKGFISVSTGTPSLTDSYIYGMSLFPPNKADALSHLDDGKSSPGRFAEVHVHRGNQNTPDLMEYKVGPLGGSMTAQALHIAGDLHYNSRPRDGIEWDGITEQVTIAMSKLEPLLKESFDGATFPDGGLIFHPQAPPGLNPEDRETRFVMAFVVDGTARGRDLHALPLTGTVHNPGVDKSKWFTYAFYYLNQGPFNTAEDLLNAYLSGSIRKFAFPKGYRKNLFDRTFPDQDPGPTRKFANKAPPRAYEPAGPRYTIHDHTVKWMGWEVTLGGSQFRGPSSHNIKFKGERIVYENSLNDVALAYASDSSAGANSVYMDATFGIGEFQNLIIGVDCPEHATLLEGTWWNVYGQKPVSAKTMCVFEADGEEALWRRKDKFAAGLRNNFLVVRYSMSVGNYDYTVDFMFFLDGKIKTKASAAGYLQTMFWDPDNPHAGSDKSSDAFGFRVSDFTFGSMHDHTFGFKVDLDIMGKKNSFDVIHWKGGDVLTALQTQSSISEKPKYFLYNSTRYLEYETTQKETGFKIVTSNPQYWAVVNDQCKNAWGAKRGYAIVPITTGSQVLPDTHPAMKAIAYTKYHVAVTKRKESEPTLTGGYDMNRMTDPLVSMDRMLDNENIVNEDLVNWVTLEFLHVPTSEDVPMTTRVEADYVLRPFNYFDTTASFDVPQYMDTEDGSVTERPPKFKPCLEPHVDDCYFCD